MYPQGELQIPADEDVTKYDLNSSMKSNLSSSDRKRDPNSQLEL